jgi:ATP-dependent Clp protease ATP-binding subunit ClpC
MPKINVYLPDDLADAVKDTGVPVSTICQRALEDAVRHVTTVRQAAGWDLDADDPFGGQARITERTRTALRLALEASRADGSAGVGTRHVLRGILDEGTNLAVLVLDSLEVQPAKLTAALAGEPASGADDTGGAGGQPGGRHFTPTAATVLEQATVEALSLAHNYIGCEHLLLGLVGEPDGAGGRVLRAAGADPRATRRAVVAALSGYVHLQANLRAQLPTPPSDVSPGSAPTATAATAASDVAAAVRAELAPVTRRLDQLEERLAGLGG